MSSIEDMGTIDTRAIVGGGEHMFYAQAIRKILLVDHFFMA